MSDDYDKKHPLQFQALREAQERHLARILDELETEVSPDKGKALLDGIYKKRPKP